MKSHIVATKCSHVSVSYSIFFDICFKNGANVKVHVCLSAYFYAFHWERKFWPSCRSKGRRMVGLWLCHKSWGLGWLGKFFWTTGLSQNICVHNNSGNWRAEPSFVVHGKQTTLIFGSFNQLCWNQKDDQWCESCEVKLSPERNIFDYEFFMVEPK